MLDAPRNSHWAACDPSTPRPVGGRPRALPVTLRARPSRGQRPLDAVTGPATAIPVCLRFAAPGRARRMRWLNGAMQRDFSILPEDLPRPVDDGAADHLAGMPMPSLALPSTRGREVRSEAQPYPVRTFVPSPLGRLLGAPAAMLDAPRNSHWARVIRQRRDRWESVHERYRSHYARPSRGQRPLDAVTGPDTAIPVCLRFAAPGVLVACNG